MIELKNIRIDENVILCDIYPEGSKEKGILSIDLNGNIIKESQLPQGYEWCKSHIKHAADALVNIAKSKDIPKEKMIMWY